MAKSSSASVANAQPGNRKTDRKLGVVTLIVLCVAFVALSFTYALQTPMHSPLVRRDGGATNPDEPAHFLYVESIASGQLPTFSIDSGDYEAHQPPLYYAVTGGVVRLVNRQTPDQQFFTARCVNIVFGLFVLLAVLFAVADLFPEQRGLPELTAIVTVFLPMNLSLAGSIGNDQLTNLIIILGIWQFGRLLRTNGESVTLSIGHLAVLGVILGAGIWTKTSDLLLYPLVVLAVAIAVSRNTMTRGVGVRLAVIPCAIGLLIGSPWLIRNFVLYHDPFAATVLFKALASRNFSPRDLIQGLGPAWYVKTLIGWTFASYWGVFDSMNLFLPAWTYWAAFVGSITAFVASCTNKHSNLLSNWQRLVLTACQLLVALTFLAFLQYNSHFFQAQGRYFYPALLPFGLFSSIGLRKMVSERYFSALNLVVGVALLVLNGIAIGTIHNLFGS